jgi:biopolymer transport protein ExbD
MAVNLNPVYGADGLVNPIYTPACYLSCALRNVIAVIMLIPSLTIGGPAAASEPVNDFYITVTADDLYLCGVGFGGLYGCIDEAISREVKSVVISASSDATVQAVQELINAVHAVGFEQVGVATFDESDT